MTTPGRISAPRSAPGGSRLFFCVPVLLAMTSGLALAQQAPLAPADQPPAPPVQTQGPSPVQPPAGSPTPPAASPAPPAPSSETLPQKKEGFFDALEKWWDKSAADFKASVDKSQEDWRKLNEYNEKAAKDAAAAAKEAADAFSKLSGTRIVEGRELCTIAPNGSPDCNAAAEKICKTKGFTLGRSADIQTNRKCSARAWLSGNPSESACTLETVVTKAACQ